MQHINVHYVINRHVQTLNYVYYPDTEAADILPMTSVVPSHLEVQNWSFQHLDSDKFVANSFILKHWSWERFQSAETTKIKVAAHSHRAVTQWVADNQLLSPDIEALDLMQANKL